jgi:hypothetical protein
MKLFKTLSIALFYPLLISIAPLVASGQERPPVRQQASEIEMLRRQTEDQKARSSSCKRRCKTLRTCRQGNSVCSKIFSSNLNNYYGHFGYRLKPKVEGIVRFDSWDPDTAREFNSSNVTECDYIAGFNYYLKENQVKLQFNYQHKTFAHGIVASRNVWLFNLQTSW